MLSSIYFFGCGRQFMEYVHYVVAITFMLFDYTNANGIDCYVCTSVNRSDPYCEDSFNTNYSNVDYLQKDCMGYRKDRLGYFPADHCIKIAGVSTINNSHTIMVRTCALDSGTLTADTEIVRMSHCGHFIFDHTPFSGCVQSCATHGCNQANPMASITSLSYYLLISFCAFILIRMNKKIIL